MEKIIIFTNEEIRKLNLKKKNNYYIIHKEQVNKIKRIKYGIKNYIKITLKWEM